MTSILVYQNMASVPSSSRARKIVDSERAREDPAMAWQKSQAKKMPLINPPVASAFHLVSRANISIRAPGKEESTSDSGDKRMYQSSGSEHEPSSVCLAAMVDEFMEDEAAFAKCRSRDTSLSKDDDCSSGKMVEFLKGFTACANTRELDLLADVTTAVTAVKNRASEICKEGMDCTSGCLKRATLKHLRAAGYNAAICKSRWDHAGGFPGGDYEYMDVLLDGNSGNTERLIVDIDFRGQFEIARPTDCYAGIVQELPAIFVGTAERLQQIVNLMCDGVKQSLKKRGMPIPPWRKPDYTCSKWFSAYKRTTNEAVHPHETVEAIVRRELARTALRGSRWHSRFTNEMELQMERAELSSGRTDLYSTTSHATTDVSSTTCRHQQQSSRPSSRFPRGRGEMTAIATDWKPPAVTSSRRSKPAGVAGLASVLVEAGLSTLASEPRPSAQSNSNPCMVAVS